METIQEAALQTMTIRVIVPDYDLPRIKRVTKKLGIQILKIDKLHEGKSYESTIVEMLLPSSFSLYALGKMVAYMEMGLSKL